MPYLMARYELICCRCTVVSTVFSKRTNSATLPVKLGEPMSDWLVLAYVLVEEEAMVTPLARIP